MKFVKKIQLIIKICYQEAEARRKAQTLKYIVIFEDFNINFIIKCNYLKIDLT